MKVLVCDDQEDRCREIVQLIGDSAVPDIETVLLFGPALTDELRKLFEIVNNCLKEPRKYKASGTLKFDSADLALFDNNLAHLNIEGARLTAEAVIGYVRAFTSVPYVVSLNKNPDVDFDLRYLIGDYESRADQALNSGHLVNKGLWTGRSADAQKGFLPWYWPKLTSAPARRRAQIAFVRKHLSNAVLATLGFPEGEALGFLSLHARGALSPEAESEGTKANGGIPIQAVTFRDMFLARNRSLPTRQDRDELVAAIENSDVSDMIARVVAADIDFWFRRDVLGPQEMLVDVPHLLMRMPFLLGASVGDIKAWNQSAESQTAPFGLDKGLFDQHLAKAQFGLDDWLRNPAFWWPTLKSDEKLGELFFNSKQEEWLDAVFCEDVSMFVERNDTGGAPVEVSAEFEGAWGQRQVAKLEGIRYAPRARFAI